MSELATAYTGIMQRGSTPPTKNGAAAILIVDDNPADRRLLLETLAGLSIKFAAQEVTTGDAAVRLAGDLGRIPGARIPDLLITDLHLPCASGIEVLRAFRANPVSAQMPALVLTGSASPADRAAIAEIPGVRFLEKPEDLEAMTAVGRTIRGMLASAVPKLASGIH